jgi:hypothetical protein
MHEGTMEAALLDGREDLEVVGESHYQDNLWRIVGGQYRPEARVRLDVFALLLAEDDNPYDARAVSVWVNGLRVGHLARADAERLRPGLLDKQAREGKPIAVAGVVVAGANREDGSGRFGVFLRYDPADFGLRLPPAFGQADERLRTPLADALAYEKGSGYSLAWLHALPADDARAIVLLRRALSNEASTIGRHFIYAELAAALYRCRDAFRSALDEYDETCYQHDAEMDEIRAAFMAEWGQVPVIDMYQRMSIRQQQADNYSAALWWAERGLAVYGEDAARPEVVDDLQRRAAAYKAELTDGEPGPS